jgi:hypothetical protein
MLGVVTRSTEKLRDLNSHIPLFQRAYMKIFYYLPLAFPKYYGERHSSTEGPIAPVFFNLRTNWT